MENKNIGNYIDLIHDAANRHFDTHVVELSHYDNNDEFELVVRKDGSGASVGFKSSELLKADKIGKLEELINLYLTKVEKLLTNELDKRKR